jgi:hypothetical protein
MFGEPKKLLAAEGPPVENDEPEIDPYGDPNKKKEDYPK